MRSDGRHMPAIPCMTLSVHRICRISCRSGIREPINKSTIIRIASSVSTSLPSAPFFPPGKIDASQEFVFVSGDDLRNPPDCGGRSLGAKQ